jgi:hypothetical protein
MGIQGSLLRNLLLMGTQTLNKKKLLLTRETFKRQSLGQIYLMKMTKLLNSLRKTGKKVEKI